MSPKLNSLLNAQLASDPFYGADAPQRIYALTVIAGDPETPLLVATQATRACSQLLKEECIGLVLSKPDASRLAQDLTNLPRARAGIEARSVASSDVMRRARLGGAE